MILKEIINKSVYGTIGYIGSEKDLEVLEGYIQYNLPVLSEFKNIIVATNYSSPLQEKNRILWCKYFPNVVILDSEVNRGHNFGYCDLDNMLVDYCKLNSIGWLCKSTNDIILTSDVLNINIQCADFYYLNGVGYGGMIKYDFDFNKIIQEDFYPQTNFYFINVNKIDYLNDEKYLDDTYKYINSIPNYNGRIWEYIEGWTCEDFLKNTIKRNYLLTFHMLDNIRYNNLLTHVRTKQIHDSSHKNIMINGICHYQYPNELISII